MRDQKLTNRRWGVIATGVSSSGVYPQGKKDTPRAPPTLVPYILPHALQLKLH